MYHVKTVMGCFMGLFAYSITEPMGRARNTTRVQRVSLNTV